MSDIQKIYENMWMNSISAFKENLYETDPLINSPQDTRRGLTVLSYLNPEVGEKVNVFLDELKSIEPLQYYYPQNELHLTVLSVLTCQQGFKLHDIDAPLYAHVFADAVKDLPPFTIKYTGITASPSCILIQGFPESGQLNMLRSRLRAAFKKAGLPTSIDLRYKISTAHTTAVRFKAPVHNSEKFIKTLYKYRNFNFGSVTIDRLELVFNNWYQNLSQTKQLSSMSLEK
ncbi:2'-5' RNA ligase family protein [Psychromonas aquimarina]|uniref:2'-5' RNA ligase family protein n=1 Tax=Psychromonas aquimarina TaxID=444919 RepID=UPI00048FE1B6|nr:2'-5' RNA ligase family protein [Psychromonas aquimarina]